MSSPDAEDLVQETFLKVLKYQDKYIHKENFKAWTFTILKNTFLNTYRRSINENTYRDQTSDSFYLNQTEVSYADNPETTYTELEIRQNIEQLRDTLRLPLKLYIDGYKYKEIAKELNLNIGTVKSRIFISRRQLKGQLDR
jgi:RNA polymerase sigma-70 factor (ECF subfamily)